MNTLTISSFLCSFVALAFGIVISSKSLKDTRYRWFAIFCGAIVLWNLSFFFYRTFNSILWERVYLLATLLLGPCTLHFFIQFITVESLSRKRTLLLWGIGSPLLLGLILPSEVLPWFQHAANTYALSLAGYAFFLLIGHLKQSKLGDWERRKQLYFIGMGIITLIALTLDGLSEFIPVPPLGKVLLILYLYFAYQTITKHKLLDLEDLIAKGVLFFVLAAMLTAIYAILVSWVEGPALFIFNTFVASFVILILFEPLKSLTERTTYELFLKGRMKTEKKLFELNDRLLFATDFGDLTHAVIMGLKDSLNATQSHFFLLDREGLTFKRIKSLNPDPSKIKTTDLPVTHDFIKYLQRRHPQPANTYSLNRDILERGRSTPKERLENSLEMFHSLNADVAFPITTDGKMLGFCTFINEKSEVPFSLNDLELLKPLSKRIAQSIKNLEVYDQIQQRDRLATVGEMAAGLAHEIKNPLSAIKGAAQYLQPSQEMNPQNEFLNVIVDEVDRLNTVVTSFLSYSKPLAQNLAETNVGQLLKESLQTISPQQRAKIHITTHIEEEHPFTLIDSGQIKQVFLNLILNAIQAIPDGGHLKVTLKKIKDEIQIIFEDNGLGISPEAQKKLFIPFYTTREGGSGLGLPICQKIIRAHQGNIRVESELRKGSKFIITLPLKTS